MKTLIQIFIVALFGLELCSPFFIAYLNQKEKLKKIYSAREEKLKSDERKTFEVNKEFKDWKSIEFVEHSYSDSKSLSIKE